MHLRLFQIRNGLLVCLLLGLLLFPLLSNLGELFVECWKFKVFSVLFKLVLTFTDDLGGLNLHVVNFLLSHWKCVKLRFYGNNVVIHRVPDILCRGPGPVLL